MKIKILILSLCLLNAGTKAQVSFGINAGANLGNIVNKYDGEKDKDVKMAPGYIISGDVNIPVGDNLLFQTGLQFESVHSKIESVSTSTFGGGSFKETFSGKSNLGFINVPVKIYYKFPAGESSFMIGAGPYLGIGITGKSKGTSVTETTIGGSTTRSEEKFDEKVKFGSADDEAKRINFGAGVNLALQMANNIKIGAYTNIGLANLNNSDLTKTKTISFGLTIGYVFGGSDGGEK